MTTDGEHAPLTNSTQKLAKNHVAHWGRKASAYATIRTRTEKHTHLDKSRQVQENTSLLAKTDKYRKTSLLAKTDKYRKTSLLAKTDKYWKTHPSRQKQRR